MTHWVPVLFYFVLFIFVMLLCWTLIQRYNLIDSESKSSDVTVWSLKAFPHTWVFSNQHRLFNNKDVHTRIISISSYSQHDYCAPHVFPLTSPFWEKVRGVFCAGVILPSHTSWVEISCFSEEYKRLQSSAACHHKSLTPPEDRRDDSSAQSHCCQHRARHGVNQSNSDGDLAPHLLPAGCKHICRYVPSWFSPLE